MAAIKKPTSKPKRSKAVAPVRGASFAKAPPPGRAAKAPGRPGLNAPGEPPPLPIAVIPVCLKAALSDPRMARECYDRFRKFSDDPAKIGGQMGRMFMERWGLAKNQAEAIAQWPGPQLVVLKHAVIQICASRIHGEGMSVRVLGKLGVPRQVSVTFTEGDHADIEFIGPDDNAAQLG